jgi:hypothetical protein
LWRNWVYLGSLGGGLKRVEHGQPIIFLLDQLLEVIKRTPNNCWIASFEGCDDPIVSAIVGKGHDDSHRHERFVIH